MDFVIRQLLSDQVNGTTQSYYPSCLISSDSEIGIDSNQQKWVGLAAGGLLRRCCVLSAVRPPMGRSHCCRRACLHMIPMNPSCFISGVCSADLSLDMALVDQGIRSRRRAATAEQVQGRPW